MSIIVVHKDTLPNMDMWESLTSDDKQTTIYELMDKFRASGFNQLINFKRIEVFTNKHHPDAFVITFYWKLIDNQHEIARSIVRSAFENI